MRYTVWFLVLALAVSGCDTPPQRDETFEAVAFANAKLDTLLSHIATGSEVKAPPACFFLGDPKACQDGASCSLKLVCGSGNPELRFTPLISTATETRKAKP